MRYTTAVAVATLATGAFAAGHGHGHAHERLHAREAEAEPNAAAEADPEPTNYTYSDGQCWGNYGCDAKTGAPAAPAAQTQAADVTAAAAPAKNTAKPSSAPAAPASQASSAASSKASPSSGSGSSSSGGTVNVQSLLQSTTGDSKVTAAKSDGSCVEGTGNPHQMDITNKSGKDLVWVCWGAAGSWVNSNAPVIALGVASGSTKTISFKDSSGGQGGACSVVQQGTEMKMGQIKNTWLEYTFDPAAQAQGGTVDVSREVSTTGTSISATTGLGCTTDMDKCVFKCNSPNGDPSTPGQCGQAGSYSLTNCSGQGSNPAKVDGGCFIGKDKITVTVS